MAGAASPSSCGWCLRPTKRSWYALSPTPPPGTLKHPEAPGVRLRGESATHGWIIDGYGDYDRDSMVLWLWNERGAHRIEDPRFLPTFYLHAAPAELPEIPGGPRSWTASARCGRSLAGSRSRTTRRSPSWRSCRGI